jgi:hypothetical protein
MITAVVVMLAIAFAAAIPGIVLAAVCHALLVGRVRPGWRRVLCALAAAFAPSLQALGIVRTVYGSEMLVAVGGATFVVVSLLLWLPFAVVLERRWVRRTSDPALPASRASAAGEPVEPVGQAVSAPVSESVPVPARPAAIPIPAPAAMREHTGPEAPTPSSPPPAAAEPRAPRLSRDANIVLWLIVAPWLLPVVLIAAIWLRVLGPFYESNAGLIFIALAVMLALLTTSIGALLLTFPGGRGASGPRSRT